MLHNQYLIDVKTGYTIGLNRYQGWSDLERMKVAVTIIVERVMARLSPIT